MNKKNITIDTDFFDQGIEATLKAYHNDSDSHLSGKQASSGVRQIKKQSHDGSFNSYRYEHVPDNQYSQQVKYSNQSLYKSGSVNARKLQSANQLQDILSRIMANLFIRCWQELKGILPQYQYLVHKMSEHVQQIDQIIKNPQDSVNFAQNIQQAQSLNAFSTNLKQSNDRKNQILQRQKRGITLDSLQKQKLNRSKSVAKIKAQRDITINQKTLQSKETGIHAENEERQQMSRVSAKSYRDKFLEYKHRSKSREEGIQKSQTYTKLNNYQNTDKIVENLRVNQNGHYSLGNLNSQRQNVRNVKYTNQSKQQILKSINHLLMDREDIYQGEDYKYYINHRDNVHNVYNQTFSYRNAGSSQTKENLQSNLHTVYHPSARTQIFNIEQYNQQQLLRAKLLEEIVEKLNYSKLRMESEQKSNVDQIEMIKKISKLQKLVLQLKRQSQNPSRIKTEYVDSKQSHVKNLSFNVNKNSDDELYRKFLDEISAIRSQINQIKNSKVNTQVDNTSSHIITEQQRTISNYQRQLQRLVTQKQRSRESQKKPNPNNQIGQKSLFNQLIQQGKTSQKKVGWDEGWQVKEEKRQFNQGLVNQNANSRRRNQHLIKQQGRDIYRYTRNQVLQEIGMGNQVQEQQRLIRQTQVRMKFEKQRREQQVRRMTQNVKIRRQQEQLAVNIEKNRPIREKYQKEWQKYQKSRDYNMDEHCCSLFPC